MRTKSEITTDREKIVQHVRNQGWCRREKWMRPNDVAALVKEGVLERNVIWQWDSQTGYAANLFGGAGVMQRKRAMLRIKEVKE